MTHDLHAAAHGSRVERLLHAVAHAGHLLPDQGPIGVFVHHNTLHSLQHLHFHEAVLEGAKTYGAEPYLPEATYRAHLDRGRIEERDLRDALADHEPSLSPERRGPAGAALTREQARWLLLRFGVEQPPAAARRWRRHELGDEPVPSATVAACEARLRTWQRRSAPPLSPPVRLRDALLARSGVDLDGLVHPLLIRWCAAYLDEGVAYWPMQNRAEGFFRSLMAQWAVTSPGIAPWQRALGEEAAGFVARRASAADALLVVMDDFGVADAEIEAWTLATLLSLRGWAGMMSRLERHPEDRGADAPPASLLDFLAVYAVMLRQAARWVARRELRHEGPLSSLRRQLEWREAQRSRDAEHNPAALHLARLLDLAGLDAAAVEALPAPEFSALVDELERFHGLVRRRLLHDAYEGRFRRQILDALAAHRPAKIPPRSSRFQVIFCFDEREEAIRRHLEEENPDIETFGAPGFFGLAMDYRGLDDPTFAPLCPVAVKPQHSVEERPAPEARDAVLRRRQRRAQLAQVGHFSSFGSRGLVRGAALSLLGGFFSALPLLGRVLAPRATAKLVERSQQMLFPDARTELTALRADEPGPGDRPLGFTPAELAERIGNILENIGLTSGFGPLVAVLGHGSTTQNNPHASAYNCGACGGRHGNASARLFASMANHPAVRELLAARGIVVPDSTRFVGGIHDTCSDDVTFFDTELLPPGQRPNLTLLRNALDRARRLSAHERCRRFDAAPFDLTPDQALAHVEARAQRIDEPRPEFGHATNASAVVGRRGLTRGLFLDRRAFLISYDPTIDETGRVLERILAAAGPVGAGINLEYYFSCVDNEVYGCGTKLPHNLSGLLGVMNGHASDLRTGLPLQTVEIHEPMRLLLVAEATPARLLEIAGRQPEVKELVVNEWVQLVALDPDSGAMHFFRNGAFVPYTPSSDELPAVAASVDWYHGKRAHLPPSRIKGDKKGRSHAA